MLDIKFIENNPELIKNGAQTKGFKVDVDRIISLNSERKSIISELESYKQIKNKISKEIPNLPNDEKKEKIQEMQELKQKEKKLNEIIKTIEPELNNLLLSVPNPPLESVPIGKDDEDNKVIGKFGEIPAFSFKPKDHVELGLDLDMLDFERGAKIAGSRSYFLKNAGVLLQMALQRYTVDFLINKGFNIIYPPFLVRNQAMVGTGYFPFGKEQSYNMEKDDLYLIGTSEVPLVSYYSDEILDESNLPIMFAGISSCFRREAGTYGKDTHGLYRVHQFEKIEQVVICKDNMEDSNKMHDFLLNNAREILESLKLPYQLVNVCSGDLGAGQIKKHDLEVWMPSRNSYGETHSCSSFKSYQARRSNLRYRNNDGKVDFPFTLNNTAIANPRILIPIMEIYQQEDGSIKIPEVLIPYMNGMKFITKNN